MGLFITFEGGEGCGKSTQARALWRRLVRCGVSAVLTHEPGGTALSSQVRRLLKQAKQMVPTTELLLFGAARAQLVEEVIRPALEKGEVVICDRFAHSTIAYQGYGRGLDLGTVQAINSIATQGIQPDLVVLLDIEPQVGLARKPSARKDRFEQEEVTFHQRVRQGYLKMAGEDPEHWLVVDAILPRAKVAQIVRERVERLLSNRG